MLKKMESLCAKCSGLKCRAYVHIDRDARGSLSYLIISSHQICEGGNKAWWLLTQKDFHLAFLFYFVMVQLLWINAPKRLVWHKDIARPDESIQSTCLSSFFATVRGQAVIFGCYFSEQSCNNSSQLPSLLNLLTPECFWPFEFSASGETVL